MGRLTKTRASKTCVGIFLILLWKIQHVATSFFCSMLEFREISVLRWESHILYVESCFSPLEFKREMLSIQNVAKLNARRTKPILLNREYHLSLARLPSLATRGLPFSRHLARSSHLTLRWLFCAF